MGIKEICKEYKISQTKLAQRFDIPLRTVQDWHAGRRTPPEYVVKMILEILEHDPTFKKTEEHKPQYAMYMRVGNKEQLNTGEE